MQHHKHANMHPACMQHTCHAHATHACSTSNMYITHMLHAAQRMPIFTCIFFSLPCPDTHPAKSSCSARVKPQIRRSLRQPASAASCSVLSRTPLPSCFFALALRSFFEAAPQSMLLSTSERLPQSMLSALSLAGAPQSMLSALSEMASVHWAKQAKGWNVESSQTLHLKKGGAKHTRP